MNKRRILAIAMSLCIVAILAVGASLAYFTDTDNATNTFTVGNVEIKLIEEERDGNNGTKPFTPNKKLYPIVGSAQGEKDALGMPTAKNYVDKMVTIQNTGSEKAYIRAYFAIPSALDNGYEDFNAGLNVLHFNFGNKVAEDGTITAPRAQSGSGRMAASGTTSRPRSAASSTMSTTPITIRRSMRARRLSSSFRAFTSTRASI